MFLSAMRVPCSGLGFLLVAHSVARLWRSMLNASISLGTTFLFTLARFVKAHYNLNSSPNDDNGYPSPSH